MKNNIVRERCEKGLTDVTSLSSGSISKRKFRKYTWPTNRALIYQLVDSITKEKTCLLRVVRIINM